LYCIVFYEKKRGLGEKRREEKRREEKRICLD
jgi:hypothetical protein